MLRKIILTTSKNKTQNLAYRRKKTKQNKETILDYTVLFPLTIYFGGT